MSSTNLDRLHRVVLIRPHHSRRAGRTFAACHNLAGLFETVLPGSKIAWFLPRHNWIDHILPEIDKVFRDHDLVYFYDKYRMSIQCNESSCLFVVTEDDLLHTSFEYIVDDFGEFEEHASSRWARRVVEAQKCRR